MWIQGERAVRTSRPLAGNRLARSNFADEKIIDALPDTQIFSAETAQQITDASTYRALGRLTAAGVIEILPESKRNQIWATVNVLAELDALRAIIGKRTTEHLSSWNTRRTELRYRHRDGPTRTPQPRRRRMPVRRRMTAGSPVDGSKSRSSML
ncbi:hypothetical protein [Rhodococcus sp. IEGM 1379]|uniref:hypothetical protein n=1 Tax=Rhodococcus sp. IEGM 1379 TaxID=3047086 RepID=UPI0024B7A3B1|nr:hypothetical protein [Rhodococcus sp. IEGM 1379]MDI9915791.1 hypothetical protein [Rhodococcus sp. IEGM 1379]